MSLAGFKASLFRHTLVSAMRAFDMRRVVRRLHGFQGLCPHGPWFSGCPCCPQIDPTGENLSVPRPSSASAATDRDRARSLHHRQCPSSHRMAPPVVPLPPGNVQAPPVYSDAPTRLASRSVGPCAVQSVRRRSSPCPRSPCITAAPAAPVPVVAQSIAVPPTGRRSDRPGSSAASRPTACSRPVGSEVVLKAGICSADGYLQTDRRVEWLLDS